jgi:hypothetical protein
MRPILALLFLLALLTPLHAQDIPVTEETKVFADFSRDWRNDPAWNDGQAEVATYDVTRSFNNRTETFQARVTTHKEWADPVTKVRSVNNQGREVFKQLVRFDVPAGDDQHHVSTMVYVGVADLKSLRIDVSTQDSIGASFKWFANHKGTLEWHQFSYHPGEGHQTDTFEPPASFVFEDALAVILRGYPFAQPPGDVPLLLRVLPSQTSSSLTPVEPRLMVPTVHGTETLELPMGNMDAYHLVLSLFEKSQPQQASAEYWFAADPKLLHVLVQYRSPDGTLFKLRSLERTTTEKK